LLAALAGQAAGSGVEQLSNERFAGPRTMAQLIAIGKNARHRCAHTLHEGAKILLGRSPRSGLSVPWDPLISREHAQLCLRDGHLTVIELPTARNPMYWDGHPASQFAVESQGEFLIGDTRFLFDAGVTATTECQAVAEHVLSGGTAAHFENASACLEAICRMPALMAKAQTDADFAAQVVDLLLESLRGSLAAAVVQFRDEDDAEVESEPALIRWNSRSDAVQRFRPSRRLMRRAFDEQRSVVHLWTDLGDADTPQFTMSSDLDWALCTPIPTTGRDKWCLYVSGRRQFAGVKDIESPSDLLGDLRLAELMAQFIGAVRQVRALEHVHSEMRQFFSPAVVETLVDHRGAAKLEPREGPVSVLFCDVRGFSKKVEESSDDLRTVLARVREALSVMTRAILKYEGVIADFQGDAALAFWGWPSANDEAAALAVRTALAIHNAFAAAQSDANHILYGFRVGVGIAYGDAIAGRIGSEEQIKVGVFGPVVNLASRLQDLTKAVGVPILIDGATAAAIADALGEAVCRRVTRVRPRGIDSPVEMFAIMPAEGEWDRLSESELQNYDRAARALEAGFWVEADRLLQKLPPHDGPANFLRLALHDLGKTPPADWNGAVPVDRRGVLTATDAES
jgi:adenylate cyclase